MILLFLLMILVSTNNLGDPLSTQMFSISFTFLKRHITSSTPNISLAKFISFHGFSYISPWGTDELTCGRISAPCKTIIYALDNDKGYTDEGKLPRELRVLQGYNEQPTFKWYENPRGISIDGENTDCVIAYVGNKADTLMHSLRSVFLSNLTFVGWMTTLIKNGGSCVVTQCIFKGFKSKDTYGAFITIRDNNLLNAPGTLTLLQCVFYNCSSISGAVVYCSQHRLEMERCMFLECTSAKNGSVVEGRGNDSSVAIDRCVFVRCHAGVSYTNSYGAVFSASQREISIANSVFTNNTNGDIYINSETAVALVSHTCTNSVINSIYGSEKRIIDGSEESATALLPACSGAQCAYAWAEGEATTTECVAPCVSMFVELGNTSSAEECVLPDSGTCDLSGHYEASLTRDNFCLLKDCTHRSPFRHLSVWPCGDAHDADGQKCFVNTGAAPTEPVCAMSCSNQAHYSNTGTGAGEALATGVCTERPCAQRTANASASAKAPCGSGECLWDQGDNSDSDIGSGYSRVGNKCSETCTNPNHYRKEDDSDSHTCALIKCESRIPIDGAAYPCGKDGCHLNHVEEAAADAADTVEIADAGDAAGYNSTEGDEEGVGGTDYCAVGCTSAVFSWAIDGVCTHTVCEARVPNWDAPDYAGYPCGVDDCWYNATLGRCGRACDEIAYGDRDGCTALSECVYLGSEEGEGGEGEGEGKGGEGFCDFKCEEMPFLDMCLDSGHCVIEREEGEQGGRGRCVSACTDPVRYKPGNDGVCVQKECEELEATEEVCGANEQCVLVVVEVERGDDGEENEEENGEEDDEEGYRTRRELICLTKSHEEKEKEEEEPEEEKSEGKKENVNKTLVIIVAASCVGAVVVTAAVAVAVVIRSKKMKGLDEDKILHSSSSFSSSSPSSSSSSREPPQWLEETQQ